MNMREMASEYRLTHWAQIMRERKESGLNIKAYCEQQGFHENVYYYWQRRLREAAIKKIAAKEPEADTKALHRLGGHVWKVPMHPQAGH